MCRMKKQITRILTALLALSLVFALCACGAAEPEADPSSSDGDGVMTHAEYDAADLDSGVTVETYVQAKQAWADGKATLYTQAEDGAYFVYQVSCTEEEFDSLTPGTKIRVSGTKSEWTGETEIINATLEVLEGNYIPEPLDVTEMLGADELAAHQNELVAFKGMTDEPQTDAAGKEVAFLYNWDGSGAEGNDLYFDVSLNGEKYTFTVRANLCGADSDVYKAVKALKVGDVIDMEGFLYWYDGPNPHIISVVPAE